MQVEAAWRTPAVRVPCATARDRSSAPALSGVASPRNGATTSMTGPAAEVDRWIAARGPAASGSNGSYADARGNRLLVGENCRPRLFAEAEVFDLDQHVMVKMS